MKNLIMHLSMLKSACLLLLVITLGGQSSAFALSLKDVPVEEPPNLPAFVKNKDKAIQLGKALFWDMNVGDQNQACASCHFNAGADNRVRNQLDPGFMPDGQLDKLFGNTFYGTKSPNDIRALRFGPEYDLNPKHFPLHNRALNARTTFGDGINNRNVTNDTNDIVSSQGVFFDAENPDDVFNVDGVNVRRVANRNSPSAINAALHLDMFWDGRASFIFNGANLFGFRDRTTSIKRYNGAAVEDVKVRIPFASHASQAVGPPTSNREMNANPHVRNWHAIAEKLLTVVPLEKQVVHPEDSVLGALSNARFVAGPRRTVVLNNAKGLNVKYEQLIKEAFVDQWWNTNDPTTSKELMKDNFTLFFGLSSLLYQNTLIADDTPFDQFVGKVTATPIRGRTGTIPPNPKALTVEEQRGLAVFQGPANCIACHVLPETTNHVSRLAGIQVDPGNATDLIRTARPQTLLEAMVMGNLQFGVYDLGFYNIGVRPTEEDIGRAAKAPDFGAPDNALFKGRLPLSYSELALMRHLGELDPVRDKDVVDFLPTTGLIAPLDPLAPEFIAPIADLFAIANNRIVTRGAFKTPNLRNQEYQGPYFHNGDSATLRHVVEFYARGGNFPVTNKENLDADINRIPELNALTKVGQQNIRDLVAFLSRALTDLRVVQRKAPFDHPELIVPSYAYGRDTNPSLLVIPATGRNGGTPATRFLNMNPQTR